MSFGSYTPYGQDLKVHAKFNKKDLEDRVTKLKANWGYKVPSFEVWAQATCYEGGESGGELFQTLMHWCLTIDGSKPNKQVVPIPQVDHFYRGKQQGKHWVPKSDLGEEGQYVYGHLAHMEEPHNATQRAMTGDKEKDRSIMTGVGFNQSTVSGGSPGALSNNYFCYSVDAEKLDQKAKQLAVRQLLIGVPLTPHGHLQFLETMGVNWNDGPSIKGGTCGPSTNFPRQFGGKGVAAKSSVQQIEGCMAYGNQMAAIYGLYFYPDCEDAAKNWVVHQTVGNKVYAIRMRLPNPQYIEEPDKPNPQLLVQEPVNHKYKGFVGDPTKGFYVPQRRTQARTTYDQLAMIKTATGTSAKAAQRNNPDADTTSAGIVSLIGPVMGCVLRGNESGGDNGFCWNKFVGKDNWSNEADALAKLINEGAGGKFKGRFFGREDKGGPQAGGRFFGWTPPAATFLFPHHGDEATMRSVGTLKEDGPSDAERAKYIPWPEWRNDGSRKLVAEREYKKNEPLVNHFEFIYKKEYKQAFALGHSYERIGDDDDLKDQMVNFKDGEDGEEDYSSLTVPKLKEKLISLSITPKGKVKADYVAQLNEALQNAATKPNATHTPPTTEAHTPHVMPVFDGKQADALRKEHEQELQHQPKLTEADTENAEGHFAMLLNSGEVDLPEGSSPDIELEGLAAKTGVARDEVEASYSLKQGIKSVTNELASGSLRRVKDDGGNHHFFSLAHSPWAPLDVYHKPFHQFNLVPAGDKDAYNNVANLTLRHTTPQVIESITQTIGLPLMVEKDGREVDIRELPLHAYNDKTLSDDVRKKFAKNMRRILSIYFDESGYMGSKAAAEGDRWNPKTKRKAMLEGIYRKKKCDNKAECSVSAGAPNKDWVILLRRVFDNEPPENLRDQFTQQGQEKRVLMTGEKEKYLGDEDVSMIKASMTVREWLQTPFHYEYLPYQKMNSVFKDGETFCTGCTRCSRPFYEYEFNYAHFYNSIDRTAHWPFNYWRPTDRSSYRWAPLPFHDPQFWSPKPVFPDKVGEVPRQHLQGADDYGGDLLPVDQRGFHNWPTHLFLLGWTLGNKYEAMKKDDLKTVLLGMGLSKADLRKDTRADLLARLPTDKTLMRFGEWKKTTSTGAPIPDNWDNPHQTTSILADEWLKRLSKKCSRESKGCDLSWIFEAHKAGKPWTFRQYLNHMYIEGQKYEEIVQGKIVSKRAAVAFGMEGYRLQRAIKYGNVCKDCAATLSLAPGLYKRTGAVMANDDLIKAGIVRAGTKQLDTWWLQWKDTVMADKTLFNPWFIFLETGQDRRFHRGREMGQHPYVSPSKKYAMEQLNLPQLTPAQKEIIEDAKKSKAQKYEAIFNENWEERVKQHLHHVEANLLKFKFNHENKTKVTECEVHVQPGWSRSKEGNQMIWNKQSKDDIGEAMKFLDKIVEFLDKTYVARDVKETQSEYEERVKKAAQAAPKLEVNALHWNRTLRDLLHETRCRMQRGHATTYDPDSSVTKFDAELLRTEYRNETVWNEADRTMYENCLHIETVTDIDEKDPKKRVKPVTYYATREGTRGEDSTGNSQWRGDGYILKPKDNKFVLKDGVKDKVPPKASVQLRQYTQSRFFITYSLHRRIQSELEARYVMERMADAIRHLFGNDQMLCEILIFGHKLAAASGDAVSSKAYVPITEPRKQEAKGHFYGDGTGNSYMHDTYETHVEQVEIEAGVEIGPTYHMPHFHLLLGINHWSYIQVDTFRMKSLLEQMFKGVGMFSGEQNYLLLDAGGLPFYTDNENPYVDIRLYPTDNWKDVISGYVRKTTQPGIFESIRARVK